MNKKLFGLLSVISTSVLALTVIFAAKPDVGNLMLARAETTYNSKVNIECPFGTEDGSYYLTLTNNDGTPSLGISNTTTNITIEFDYTTGKFKFPLDGKYVNFKESTLTTGGTTFEYTTICSGNSGYVLAKHGDAAVYSKTSDYTNYIPLLPYYSSDQYEGWCVNCSGHKDHFEQSADYLYHLVIDKDNVDEIYKPVEEVPVGNTLVITGSNLTKTTTSSGYAGYNGSRDIDDFTITTTDVMVSGTNLQFKKNTGTMTITHASISFTLTSSSSSLTINNNVVTNGTSGVVYAQITIHY